MATHLADAAARLADAFELIAATPRSEGEPFRGLYGEDPIALTITASAVAQPDGAARFDTAAERLGLSELERAALALCALPELQPETERIIATLTEDPRGGAMTPWLLARLLREEEYSTADILALLERDGRLRRTGALRLSPGRGAAAAQPIVVAPQLIGMLIGADLAGTQALAPLRRIDEPALPVGRMAHQTWLARLAGRDEGPELHLVGSDAALVLSAGAGRGLVLTDLASIAEEPTRLADLIVAALLEERIAVVDHLDECESLRTGRAALAAALGLGVGLVLWTRDPGIAAPLSDRPILTVTVPALEPQECAAARRSAAPEVDTDALTQSVRLDVSGIQDAVALARRYAQAREVEIDERALLEGAHAASTREIHSLAELLPAGPGWESLVLAPVSRPGLEAMQAFLRHRRRVLDDWGYASLANRRGLIAMFVGESGTGKTLAARIVASELGLDVFRVDLSALYSKWLGETERNLDRVLRAAGASNAVVFFDEADVVLGKRSETESSHDRYANLTTSYLLQRIESYDGVVVLATNFRSNIDDAFMRRIDVLVDFPRPDESARRKLWELLLPAAAPRGEDVDLDFLAERFELAGGAIKNCSLTAAYLAVDDGAVIGMAHLVRAVAMEFRKLGRLVTEADFDRFHELVPAALETQQSPG